MRLVLSSGLTGERNKLFLFLLNAGCPNTDAQFPEGYCASFDFLHATIIANEIPRHDS
jgi:hypothetical protein